MIDQPKNSGITKDDWLKALRDADLAPEHDADAITIDDFAVMFDLKRAAAQNRLEALVTAGKAFRTKKRQITPGGKMLAYNAYRLTP